MPIEDDVVELLQEIVAILFLAPHCVLREIKIERDFQQILEFLGIGNVLFDKLVDIGMKYWVISSLSSSMSSLRAN
jgi:hypothetical protein